MIGIGLYGANGHQIFAEARKMLDEAPIASAGIPESKLAKEGLLSERLHICGSLDELLEIPEIKVISLCSSRRADQAEDAVKALRAGRHVFAEKPSAMNEEDLDRIIAEAERRNLVFREMGNALQEPSHAAMRSLIGQGVIGEIVQVFVQRSYPMHEGRPKDENVDGGLLLQVGVHLLRQVEQVGGLKIAEANAYQTDIGVSDDRRGLRSACTFHLKMENGALATGICNYFNPEGCPSWGDASLKFWGTKGMIESSASGRFTQLIVGKEDRGPLVGPEKKIAQWDELISLIGQGKPMTLSLEEEIRPLRWCLRARSGLEKQRVESGATLFASAELKL